MRQAAASAAARVAAARVSQELHSQRLMLQQVLKQEAAAARRLQAQRQHQQQVGWVCDVLIAVAAARDSAGKRRCLTPLVKEGCFAVVLLSCKFCTFNVSAQLKGSATVLSTVLG